MSFCLPAPSGDWALVYAMMFTPCRAGGSVAVPVAGVMGVVFLGLSVQQQQVRVHLCCHLPLSHLEVFKWYMNGTCPYGKSCKNLIRFL